MAKIVAMEPESEVLINRLNGSLDGLIAENVPLFADPNGLPAWFDNCEYFSPTQSAIPPGSERLRCAPPPCGMADGAQEFGVCGTYRLGTRDESESRS